VTGYVPYCSYSAIAVSLPDLRLSLCGLDLRGCLAGIVSVIPMSGTGFGFQC